MTDDEMQTYLRDNGYPEQLVRAGRQGLIDRWDSFVAEVEKGYRGSLEEYRKDLDLRGIIAMLGLDDTVLSTDERLRPVLIATEIRVWESGPAGAFWDFGYPRNAGKRLIDDLRSEDLL